MDHSINSPLDELNETALYKLLGDAWCAQLSPELGSVHELTGAAHIGKREFDAVRAMLREDLGRPFHHGLVACVSRTIKRSGTWRMPASVVTALAIRQGLAVADMPATPVMAGPSFTTHSDTV